MVNFNLQTSDLGGIYQAYGDDVEATRDMLAQFFYPLNQDLYRLLESLGYENFPKFKHDELVEEKMKARRKQGQSKM